MSEIAIIGAGLAGCECAWKLAQAGIRVRLFEMKPGKYSEAHSSDKLAELVCSNSLRSDDLGKAVGVLKLEMRELDSLVMEAADATRIPAGKALAVDRERFAEYVTDKIANHPNIELIRQEVTSLDSPLLAGIIENGGRVVLAAGPLLSGALADSLAAAIQDEETDQRLYFYDAIAPIIDRESIDMDKVFWGSRYHPEDDDYLNCPLNEEQYDRLVNELNGGVKVQPREFEKEIHFDGCLPVEEMAERGRLTLAFGPLKPVGLDDPRTGKRPFAVVQLRAENAEKTAFNLVGFQTKLTYPEQKRVFRMIPGLENAEFLRLGSIHRNTFVNAPQVLNADLELIHRPGVHLAGQITGVEGYVESAACGLWLGLLLAAKASGAALEPPPAVTALGALLNHLKTEAKKFQPSNANFGLMPALNKRAGKRKRMEMYAERARESFAQWLETLATREPS